MSVVHLRQVLPLHHVAWLTEIAAWLYSEIEAPTPPEPPPEEINMRQTYSVWQGFKIEDVFGFMLRRDKIVYGRDLLDVSYEIAAAIASHYDRPFFLQPSYSFVRRMTPGFPNPVRWHCDAEAASTVNIMHGPAGCISTWVPLVSVGEDAPSLQFIIGSEGRLRDDRIRPGRHRLDAWVETVEGESYVPIAQPGDVVAFDQYILHRTQQMEVRSPRTSFELRFVS